MKDVADNVPEHKAAATTTAFGVFRDKLFALGRDEDGAALVITLAIFFLMYLGCMGVCAVSIAVKERIHLQNAADAAAYSAAVVQADTLSRVATINRAMAWTYVQMTRRQMDYIVYRWLKHTYDHFQEDRRRARSYHECMGSCWRGRHTHSPEGWFIGSNNQMDKVQLNGFNSPILSQVMQVPLQNEITGSLNLGSVVPISSVNSQLLSFDGIQGATQYASCDPLAFSGSSAMLSSFVGDITSEAMSSVIPSNYDTLSSIGRMIAEMKGPNGEADTDSGVVAVLGTQIYLDRLNIAAMNICSRRLVFDMPKKIENVVHDIVAANVPEQQQDKCRYYIMQNENPLLGEEVNDPTGLLPGGYFCNLYNLKRDERRFLRFVGYNDWPVNVFKESSSSLGLSSRCAGGLEQWFVRGNGWRRTDGGVGLQRSYKHWEEGPFAGWHGSHSPNPASCWNTVKLDGSPQSIALYSSWEWFSGKWLCFWYVTLSGVKDYHIGLSFLDKCSHKGGRSGHDFTEQIQAILKVAQSVEKYPSYLASALQGLKTDTGDGDTSIPTPDPNTLDKPDSPIESYKDGCYVTMDWIRWANTRKRETLILPWSGYSRLYADAPHLYNSAYVGERAKPLILKQSYFGKAGTISVGIRQKNENVFLRMLGKIEGIFKAFDPDWNEEGEDTHTYVFASAKAGYRDKGSSQSRTDYGSRAYRIDWQPGNQDWNLCQSDWDAVFVPVRRAYSYASMGQWDDGYGDGMLEDWVVNKADEWKPLAGNGGDDYICDNIYAPGGVLRGNGHDGTLKWRELSHVMFH